MKKTDLDYLSEILDVILDVISKMNSNISKIMGRLEAVEDALDMGWEDGDGKYESRRVSRRLDGR